MSLSTKRSFLVGQGAMRIMNLTQKHRQNNALTFSVLDDKVDGASSSDESQAHSSGHYETPDEIAQSSGEGSRHDYDTESDGADGSSDIGHDMVRRHPTRARRAPSNWWTSSTNATATVFHEEPISMQHNSCQTAQDIESDSPKLKIVLASPARIAGRVHIRRTAFP
jgi:hypothetical protein